MSEIAYSSVVKKMKQWSGIHTQMRITTKSQPLLDGHLLPVPAKFGRRPFPRSSVILFTNDRTNERMTENDHNIRLIGEGNNNHSLNGSSGSVNGDLQFLWG